VDAPAVPVGLAGVAVACLVGAVLVAVSSSGWWWLVLLAYAGFFGLSTASYLYTTRRGKFRVWAGLLADAGLDSAERVVDLGCGRGAVLVMAGRRFPHARPLGVDLLLSSLAIHNIPGADARTLAIREAARVLRPGGRLIMVDYRHVARYAEELRALGLREVTTRPLGWRFWYGGPWGASALVTAIR
jgi:arsenite methyltransferase